MLLLGRSEDLPVLGGAGVLREFTASDGMRIRYRDEGRGRPLVLLHGLMAHGGFFRAQAELAGDFRLVTVDLRGHGASRCPGDRPTLPLLARDVAELCDHLELQDAIGIGWSLGATVLWHVLVGASGQRFAGAVVVDMTARVRNDAQWSLGLTPAHCDARSDAIANDFHDFALSAGSAIFADAQGQHAGLAEWAGTEFARNDPDVIAAIWASLESDDVRPLLGRITQPTLIVHGGRSPLYGAETALHLADALPSAFAVRLDRAGHAPHLEEPGRFNRLVRDFAASLDAAPALIRNTHTI